METKILRRLVGIPSTFPNEREIGGYILSLLKNYPGKVRKQIVTEDRFNIIYEIGHGPAFLLLGHIDTVPMTDGWNTDPYTLTAKRDRLYGLGSWDMKGGLSLILNSIRDITPKGYKLKVAFVCDEENYSVGIEKVIKSGWLNDVDGCISIEPGFIYGDRGICLGRIGRSVYDVEVKSAGGHTYLAREGDNAIDITSLFIRELQKLKRVKHVKFGDSNVFPRSIYAEAKGMSIPSTLNMQIEVNMVPPQTTDSVLKSLRLLAAKIGEKKIKVNTSIRPTPFCQPFEVSKDHAFVKSVSLFYKQSLKNNPIYYYRNSVADDNRVAALGIPTITIGPKGGNAHLPNEWVSQKSLERIYIFLNKVLLNYNTY